MTKAQQDAVAALRKAIDRMDRVHRGPVARGRTGRRCFKRWDAVLGGDGVVTVTSVVGWRRAGNGLLKAAEHPFDDVERVIRIGRRGGLSGAGNIGHGDAGDTATVRGPRVLYGIDAQRIY